MTDADDRLEAARQAVGCHDWVSARAGFEAARDQQPLGADDLWALANCSWWLGDLDEALPVLQEAHDRYLDAGNHASAALVALDIGYTLSLRGEQAPASGWMSRAARLLEGLPECAEHGYLEYVAGFETALYAADLDAALGSARRIHALGQRFCDPTLTAAGVLGEGRVLVKLGRVAEGMALLDEAMVAALSDELDPGWAGNIYCHLMLACHEIADLRRAGEWTEATARWCESMPGAGPFMGICRVHRAQVLQARGDSSAAEREVLRVCEEFAHFNVGIVAEAHYELGEIRRQRGDLAGAEAAFAAGHRLGRDPQPGLALLRLAAGRPDAADSAIRSALALADGDPIARARLLPAAVETALAAGATERARAACDELERVASTYGTAGFTAQSLYAQGTLALADGKTERALPLLRQALGTWHEVGAPYEAARVRMLLARAYEALADREASVRERRAAEDAFTRIGASWRDTAASGPTRRRVGGLTERQTQVLELVASGKSNQQIAADLVLSVRTVERHLATIYEKLGVHGRSARAAAVRYALREGLGT